MNQLRQIIARLAAQRGQSMTEYAILLTWICLLIFAAITTLGHNISSIFSSTAGRV